MDCGHRKLSGTIKSSQFSQFFYWWLFSIAVSLIMFTWTQMQVVLYWFTQPTTSTKLVMHLYSKHRTKTYCDYMIILGLLESTLSSIRVTYTPGILIASLPGHPCLQFLHTASNQKLEAEKAWEQGYSTACYSQPQEWVAGYQTGEWGYLRVNVVQYLSTLVLHV